MADIFNRRTDVHGGSFSADAARITFPNVRSLSQGFSGDMGLLIQQLGVQYQQQVTRLYEVGAPAVYYVAGRTNGTMTLNRVVGPRTITQAFYQKFGDVCQAKTNNLDFTVQTGCGGGQGNPTGYASYTASFCVITGIGLNIESNSMVINESLQLMFSGFNYSTGR